MQTDRARTRTSRRLPGPLLLTGFGLGAFLDGILLHQVLQWHHLVSEYRSPDDLAGLEANTLWDGLFHLTSWVVVLVGVLWAVRTHERLGLVDWRRLVGPLLVGWGSFHVVDQIVLHMVLGAHHIRMGDDYQLYDWGYTAIGVGLVVVGTVLSRPRDVSRSTSSRG